MPGAIARSPCLPLGVVDQAVLYVVAQRAHRQVCQDAELVERELLVGFDHVD